MTRSMMVALMSAVGVELKSLRLELNIERKALIRVLDKSKRDGMKCTIVRDRGFKIQCGQSRDTYHRLLLAGDNVNQRPKTISRPCP
jgi:hypothetical protein